MIVLSSLDGVSVVAKLARREERCASERVRIPCHVR